MVLLFINIELHRMFMNDKAQQNLYKSFRDPREILF